MNDETEPETPEKPAGTRQSTNLVAFLVTFGFIWLVFDNMALALIFALLIAGGSEAAQRAKNKSSD